MNITSDYEVPFETKRQPARGWLVDLMIGAVISAPLVPMAASEGVAVACERRPAVVSSGVCQFNRELQDRIVEVVTPVLGRLPLPEVEGPVFDPHNLTLS